MSSLVLDQNDHAAATDYGLEDRTCPGCKLSVINENGGLVVAFGQSFFHLECFRCAKCGDKVTADTNLLLLSDGSPICANCSYSCNICKLPILDEAIMTGDDAYHAHCFKCKVCNNRIDELIFAKTSNGIYCMNCHNDRMAKIREHARRKKEKEKALERRPGGGTGSVRSREGLANEFHQAVDCQSGTQQLESTKPHRPPLVHQGLLTVPGANARSLRHQSSTESMALQLDVPAHPESAAWLLPSSGSTSKRDKRNSINPAFSLGPIGLGSPPTSSSTLPTGSTMLASSITRSPPPLTSNGRDSPSLASPRRDAFPLYAPSSSSRHSSISSLPPVDETAVHPSSAQLPTTRAQAEERINTRARAASATLPYDTPETQRPPLKSSLTLDRVPVRTHSLNPSISSIVDLPNSPDPASSSFSPHQGGGRLSPVPGLRMQRSFDQRPRTPLASAAGTRLSSSSVDDLRTAAQSDSRSVSPSHMADVPTGIEDSSDEADVDSGHGMSVDSHELVGDQQRPSSLDMHKNAEQQQQQQQQQQPPPVPLKAKPEPLTLQQQQDPSASESPSTGTQPSTAASDDLDEFYYPAERRTSIATFIAPALPPIRFSMNGSDFSELLMSVGGNTASLKNLDQLGRLADQDPMVAMKTPPPSAATEMEMEVPLRENEGENGAVVPGTPMSEITITGQPPPPPPSSLSQQSRDMGTPETDGDTTPNSAAMASSNSASPPPAPNPDSERTPKKANSLKRTGSVGGPRPSTAGSSRSPSHNHSHSNSNSSIHRLRTASGSPSEPQSSTIPSLVLSPSPIEPFARTRTMTEAGTLGAATAAGAAAAAAGLRSSPSLRRTGRQMTEPPMSQSQQQHSLDPRPRVLFTPPEDQSSQEATAQLTMRSLREALAHALDRGADYIRLEKGFVEVILSVIEQKAREHSELKSKLDGAKRASKQYIEGLTVAQEEYDHELKARRAAEAEVMQLKVLLSGQAARLTALVSETKTQEIREQKTQEMSQSLDGLQKHLSQLRVERDITLAEVEELTASKSTDSAAGGLGRSLSVRLDTIKSEYKNELVPLQHQREQLMREIDELKSVRSLFLEETTVLNARNEELSRLNAQYTRRLEQLGPNPNVAPPVMPIPVPTTVESPPSREEPLQPNRGPSFDGDRQLWMDMRSNPMASSSSHTLVEERETVIVKGQHLISMDSNNNFPPTPRQVKKSGIGAVKWPGSLKAKEIGPPTPMKEPSLSANGHVEHAWQQSSNIRFARCEQCGDKMWGSQLRCTGCNISIHPRCLANVHSSCSRSVSNREEAPAQVMSIYPSMFGRELTEQVKADTARGFAAPVPVIVAKCIEAVEALALDFEGIYRKTGGSGQSKIITQLFERGDYASFDLRDQDRFNDICSVTSVLKNYFRSLPTPLLTFDLHDDFMMAAEIKDTELKGSALTDLVKKLPLEHHETLRVLMLHLHRVREQSEINLMNARNLGVVFGPTLMRSRDPTAEFSDMAGKALTIEWLVDNATVVFAQET